MPATDVPGTEVPDGSLPRLVLRGARDLGRLDTAFDAELLMSTLLGGVYAGTLPDRGQALTAFTRELDGYLSDAGTGPARLARAVVASLAGSAGYVAEDVVVAADVDAAAGVDVAADPDDGPAWVAALGTARATGGWAFGDRYGDQTTYIVTFGYPDESTGGPEHAVLLLVDHNLGLVKDLVVAAPAGPAIDGIRDSVMTDPDAMTWLAEIDPATVRAAAAGYLRATDNAPDLPVQSGLRDNRAIVAARLATLPEPVRRATSPSAEAGAAVEAGAAGAAPGDDRATLVAQFLRSPEAKLSGLAGATGARGEAVGYGLGLIVDFADARGGDPLRWSPRAVEVFLMDWVHGRAVLDEADARSLPDALGAWVLWAGRLLALPDAAVQATFEEVGTRRAEFARLCSTGERQTPAVKAMRRLIADAVDVTDEAAVEAWLRAHEPED